MNAKPESAFGLLLAAAKLALERLEADEFDRESIAAGLLRDAIREVAKHDA
jgi:hypothetical protein